MTKKLPRITAGKTIKALERAGFFMTRQSGSHKIYKNKKGNRTTVPYHSGEIINLKTLISILKDADITIDEFRNLLK